MDLWNMCGISSGFEFIIGLSSIMLINIILSGDNAVVIAMAVRSLSPKQRKKGIMLGTLAAVVLRIGLTLVAAKLLEISFVKFIGGCLIVWLSVKLFMEGAPENADGKEVKTLGKAVVTILIADLIMSLDNVLAVAGASEGNLFLLIFGLGTSIPIVILSSQLLSKLMDRYPVILYVGAAVLGRVGGEMIISGPFVIRVLHGPPGHYTAYAVQALFALGVIVAGKTWMRWRVTKKPAVVAAYEKGPFYVAGWDLI